MKRMKYFLVVIIGILVLIFGYYKLYTSDDYNYSEEPSTHIGVIIIDEPIYEERVKVREYQFNELESVSVIYREKMKELDYTDDHMKWYVEYKEMLDKYSHILDMPETVYDYFTDEEIFLVQRMVETECYQQDFLSKVNVACVAFNRYDSGIFGKTITEIITKPNQFAYGRKNISEETILAVEYAFEIGNNMDNAVGFHSGKMTKTFNGWEYITTDNCGHHFYKIKGE